ncbi:hypothetical protein H1P_4830002 [Hyella patelloides LEGE 07179]|uniref:Uncharacterized protein n=1 Tax=Hyella patelloides LEGE 07179 TaxID=945734 RepID=A0A563VZ00_9CYAN|nr:hypothetical protein H1P_4830002 [Hyella patelloides LEGE 07179]
MRQNQDWSVNPQFKTEFLHLQAEIDSVLQKIKTGAEISSSTSKN